MNPDAAFEFDTAYDNANFNDEPNYTISWQVEELEKLCVWSEKNKYYHIKSGHGKMPIHFKIESKF